MGMQKEGNTGMLGKENILRILLYADNLPRLSMTLTSFVCGHSVPSSFPAMGIYNQCYKHKDDESLCLKPGKDPLPVPEFSTGNELVEQVTGIKYLSRSSLRTKLHGEIS